jgi:hypothetical protein
MPQVFVRTLSGSTLCLAREGSVADLKQTVEEREGEGFEMLYIMFLPHRYPSDIEFVLRFRLRMPSSVF